jgi:Dehydrogenases with different specificities (related to short-chain alcohol dehydrogenases)
MLLKNKNAIIYGAGGSLGGAVAKAMAAAGARVFCTGHRLESVQQTAEDILKAGGKAEVDVIDAFDAAAIESHIKKVKQVDISFNAAGVAVKQDVPLIELRPEEFVDPITQTMRTEFLTATAAGRVMKQQGSGIILFLTATPGGIGYPYTGGFAAACCALESFSRNLALELGVYGIRVATMRSGGSIDSNIFKSALESDPENVVPVIRQMEKDTALKRMPVMADIANTAVFLASDMAAMITGVTIDVTGGTTAGMGYRVHE